MVQSDYVIIFNNIKKWVTKPQINIGDFNAKCNKSVWKATYYKIPIWCHSWKDKETVKRSVVGRGSGEEKEEWIGRAHKVFRAVKLLSMTL